MIEFFVPGKPVPKGRPRVTRSGHTFTPARTKTWEQLVGWSARLAMRGQKPLTGRLNATLTFYGARANADLDNLVKAVLDALNGVVYLDDKQVEVVEARRFATNSRGVRVTVRPLS